jgi:hypothetical protein
MEAPTKQAVAIIIGAMLVASAVVFQAYQHRYEVAGVMGGLFVRLDSRTGQLSACALVDRPLNEAIVGSIMKSLSAGGYSQKEITDYMTAREGQMLCSAWNG